MTERTGEMLALFQRSGEASTDDPLVLFLYLLMRDEVVPGAVEGIVQSVVDAEGTTLTNGFLADYAKDIAGRLRA